ncbi:hypothetical protein KSC_015080 [Ktedonobacter sp. SOSP1-52]|nr:hypothetical protein KSC_015080 [Ktedonobacter sp. SOSP1-52]
MLAWTNAPQPSSPLLAYAATGLGTLPIWVGLFAQLDSVEWLWDNALRSNTW